MIPFFDVIVLPIKSNNWYESPVIAALLGFILASFVDVIRNHFKEQRLLEGYEYILLKETMDILESNISDKKCIVDEFLSKFYTDLRFTKLDSMRLIKDSLDKAKKNEDCANEMARIDDRLIELSKERSLSKIKNEIKKIISWYI